MLENVFLGLSLVGAEWVLYLLVILSIVSVTIMVERALFYRNVTHDLQEFRVQLRSAIKNEKWDEALKMAQSRSASASAYSTASSDFEGPMVAALLEHKNGRESSDTDVLNEVARDAVMRARLQWERNLSILATIGNNAPFIGLFGTVLGIIKAFRDLSQAGAGAQTVSAGISEALIATAVGILVAIPAVAAYNLFQRKVRSALTEAEALKSFTVGKLAR